MRKLKINKRENILQDNGDYLFRIHLTISKKLEEHLPYTSIDYTVEFLNNGDIEDVNNIDREDYKTFIVPKIQDELFKKRFEIDYLFQSQIIT